MKFYCLVTPVVRFGCDVWQIRLSYDKQNYHQDEYTQKALDYAYVSSFWDFDGSQFSPGTYYAERSSSAHRKARRVAKRAQRRFDYYMAQKPHHDAHLAKPSERVDTDGLVG